MKSNKSDEGSKNPIYIVTFIKEKDLLLENF